MALRLFDSMARASVGACAAKPGVSPRRSASRPIGPDGRRVARHAAHALLAALTVAHPVNTLPCVRAV